MSAPKPYYTAQAGIYARRIFRPRNRTGAEALGLPRLFCCGMFPGCFTGTGAGPRRRTAGSDHLLPQAVDQVAAGAGQLGVEEEAVGEARWRWPS